MTSNDLKTLASRELEDMPPMPSVVSGVLAEGARERRRRRTVGVGLAAAGIVGVVAAGTAVVPGLVESGSSTPQSSAGVANRGPGASDGPITDSRAEFDTWAAQEFAAILPERFSAVRPGGPKHTFVTHVDGRRIRFNINISQTDWEHTDLDPSAVDLTPSCESVAPASCATLPGQNAIAYHETTDDAAAYAGMEMYLDGRSSAADQIALNFFGKASEGPMPISNAEILDMVQSPRFEQIWREYTEHPDWVYSSRMMTASPPTSDQRLPEGLRQRAKQRAEALRELKSQR